ELSAVEGGRNNDLVQRHSGHTESMHQRAAPIAWSDDGNAALQTPSLERPCAPMTGWYFKLSSTEKKEWHGQEIVEQECTQQDPQQAPRSRSDLIQVELRRSALSRIHRRDSGEGPARDAPRG